MTAPIDPYAVTSWGETASSEPFGITLPSGQRCLVRRLEMEDVLANGLLNNLDAFSSSLLDEAGSAKAESPEEVLGAFQDKEKFGKLGDTINKIVLITVVKPSVFPLPVEGDIDPETGLLVGQINPMTGEKITGRVKGRVYLDQINFMDKMFIFQSVFEGLNGLDRFREGQEAGLGTVEDVQAVPTAPVVPTGHSPFV